MPPQQRIHFPLRWNIKLRPFFPYLGSKWSLSKYYPTPDYGEIIEPFAGSACYSLAYPNAEVLVRYLNPDVCAVWEYLISVDEAEIAALPTVTLGTDLNALDIPEPARILIGLCSTVSSRTRHTQVTAYGMSKRPKDRGRSNWDARFRPRIISQLAAIRHWRVECGRYQDCVRDTPATWFIDPPYQEKGHMYPWGRDIDFKDLAGWCLERPGQIIVCEGGGNWLPFRPLRLWQSTVTRKRYTETVFTRPCQTALLF